MAEYIGEDPAAVAELWSHVVRKRYHHFTTSAIIRQTETKLSPEVVTAISAGAQRLLPIDNTPTGKRLRLEKEQLRVARAKQAEERLFAELTRLGYEYKTEAQQQKSPAGTPDVRFEHPVMICGKLCSWIEVKDFFGFRKNPYVASKIKKQLRKYAEHIGPGLVVYSCGYEGGHLDIARVRAFREKELRQGLVMQVKDDDCFIHCVRPVVA